MIKKVISLLLVFMLVLSIGMPVNAFGAVKDYTGHWAENTIQLWLDKGYIAGYSDGSFKPEGTVTRAEFVKMVNSLFNYTEKSEISFTDVKAGDWYYQEVQKAYKAGYIAGVSDTKFAPNASLTREQAAVIISRIMKLKGNSEGADVFNDSSKISSYAKDGVGAAAKANLLKGYEDNTFKPQNSIKRAEAIVILNRTVSTGNEEKPDELKVDKPGTVVENVTMKKIHITDKVGNGEVTLKNVTVTGELLVEGGGENSIILENSTINNLTTNKADGKVRILVKGSTVVDSTSVKSGVILEQQNLTGKGFKEVTVENGANAKHTVTVKADIGSLIVNTKIYVNIQSGTIESMKISKEAEGSTINVSKSAKIVSATVNGEVSFTGTGTIVTAKINISGVTFEQKPEKIELAQGVEAPKIVTPATGGGSGGGGGSNNYAVLTQLYDNEGKIIFNTANTTYTAIKTTASAITLTAITTIGDAINISTATTHSSITTKSAVQADKVEYVFNITYDKLYNDGVATVIITEGNGKKYTITISKQ